LKRGRRWEGASPPISTASLPARSRAIAYADHITIAGRVEAALDKAGPGFGQRPALVGICGAQGSGKSTLTETLAEHFRGKGLKVAALSLDDLYLRRAEREHLAATVHPLLTTRGVPGTHDVQLGEAVLDALGKPGTVRVPRFDKSVDDRFSEGAWDIVEGPVDLILFEGWCVGASAESEHALAEPINALERTEDADGQWRRYANAALADDYQRLFARIDLLILLAAPSFEIVARWRTEQEEHLRRKLHAEGREQGGGLMSSEQIARFVQHYERITRHILTEMPGRADIVIKLNEERQIIAD
jgi:D-glycerate 3-kinase